MLTALFGAEGYYQYTVHGVAWLLVDALMVLYWIYRAGVE